MPIWCTSSQNLLCRIFLSKISSSIVRYWDMDIPNLVWNCQVSRSLVGLSIAPSRFKNKNIYMLGTSILWSATVYEYLMQFSALDLKILECNYRPSTSEKKKHTLRYNTRSNWTLPTISGDREGRSVVSVEYPARHTTSKVVDVAYLSCPGINSKYQPTFGGKFFDILPGILEKTFSSRVISSYQTHPFHWETT